MAQMSVADTALAVTLKPPSPLVVSFIQDFPSKCQELSPGPTPALAPNAHTSRPVSAVMPDIAPGPAMPFGSGMCLATDHCVPFQCRMSAPNWVTAQMSVADT